MGIAGGNECLLQWKRDMEVIMIFSKLSAKDPYSACPKVIQDVLHFFETTDTLSLAPGCYELQGKDIYVNVMDMTTHSFEGSHPEVHQKYIDLMYWPEGGERIGVAPYLGTEEIFEAHPENDIILLENVDDESILLATAGCFAVFFPWDAHRPALMLKDTPATSRKCVAKISVQLLI
jgi:biofilm protein TabA